MKIDAYMQVNQLYNANKPKKGTKADKSGTKDSLEISSFGNAYQVAKQAASQSPDVRQERIQEIQTQLASGSYKVSLEDVADKMADMLLS
ncbi:MAG: flagellar biosynthesis anti-sigma factor FlgM [Lachnospiraceae bacterium]|nr:flagellar biosynthesis anti-sigma factor FlgM [Lachnospiraceae bacterium]